MSQIFLRIINMSISASYVVLAVLLLRLILKKAPKWITVLLWGMVAVRLVCPFFMESGMSLLPKTEWIKPEEVQISESVAPDTIITDAVVDENVDVEFTPNEPNITIKKGVSVSFILSCIWLAGVAALLLHTFVSCNLLKRRVNEAVILRDNIYQSENVVSPFVLGMIKPKIYLPFSMNEKDMGHVIAHEMAHIRRKDHWWKPLGFLLLTLHWFNPLMWLAYVLLCRDIELACDEKVIGALDRDARADYSQALLTCSVNRRMIAACPLAFGEVGVKDRVKSVLHYKKPAFWLIIAAIAACVAVTVCFLTNPIDTDHIGVKSLSAESVGSDVVELKIKYSYPTGGYRIRYVAREEGEYGGDGIRDYDGALGEYRILIEFGDTEPSKEFMEAYPVGEVVELENAPTTIRLKRVHPQDHGFYLYVGFDSPVEIEPVDHGTLKAWGGSVTIPVHAVSENLIYSSGDPDEPVYVCVQDYGCSVKNVSIELETVRFENGEMLFAIHWRNDNEADVDIGPDFQVYKYEDNEPVKLAHKSIWLFYAEFVSGNATHVQDNGVTYRVFNERTTSYNLSEHYDMTSPGRYRFEAHGAWVEFKVITKPDARPLQEKFPAYFGLDASSGLDVYVWQMAQNSYSFGVLPHAEQPRDWISPELMALRGATAEEMRAILATYSLDVEDIYVIPWQNPISGYLADWNIVNGFENTEEKKQAYVRYARDILFGTLTNQGVEPATCTLLYDSPIYSYVMSPSAVSKVVMEDGIVYKITEGYKKPLGTATKTNISYFNFDSFIKQYEGFDHSELARELRNNNKIAYEVTPDPAANGIAIYYIMEQKSGETLIVYGHYQNGEKENEIRFIYSLNP